MRRLTKAILIALAVLIVPAIYAGYLLYQESKIIDLITVKVINNNGEGVEGVPVSLLSTGDKRSFISINGVTRGGGVVYFRKIPPGEYEIRLLNKKDCQSFRIMMRGVNVYVEAPLEIC